MSVLVRELDPQDHRLTQWAGAPKRHLYPACATEQLFGYVVDRTGSYRIAWLVVAAAVLIGLVSALRLREDRQR